MEAALMLEEMAALAQIGIQLTDLGAAEAAEVCITMAVMADYTAAAAQAPGIAWVPKREAMARKA
jgi:hypothetical protein